MRERERERERERGGGVQDVAGYLEAERLNRTMLKSFSLSRPHLSL